MEDKGLETMKTPTATSNHHHHNNDNSNNNSRISISQTEKPFFAVPTC